MSLLKNNCLFFLFLLGKNNNIFISPDGTVFIKMMLTFFYVDLSPTYFSTRDHDSKMCSTKRLSW